MFAQGKAFSLSAWLVLTPNPPPSDRRRSLSGTGAPCLLMLRALGAASTRLFRTGITTPRVETPTCRGFQTHTDENSLKQARTTTKHHKRKGQATKYTQRGTHVEQTREKRDTPGQNISLATRPVLNQKYSTQRKEGRNTWHGRCRQPLLHFARANTLHGSG